MRRQYTAAVSERPEARPRAAVYPGSFDPITLGHVEIIERATKMFDTVIVAVGQHPTKQGWFPPDERVRLVEESVEHLPGVRVERFSGLVVEFCRAQGAGMIVRGLRAMGDFESEFQMALANRDLAPTIETVFLVPSPDRMFVSSSLVREIATHGGDFERYLTPPVARAVHQRLQHG
jgi:pantetheine-phosphate adenylyltransferase